MYTALLALGFHSLFRTGELAFFEHAITVNSPIHIGATKASIILSSSKANHTGMPQQITVKATNIACPVTALTAYAKSHSPKPDQLFL